MMTIVTLIVSLIIPDGIVLAGDSLATIMQYGGTTQGDIDVTCPECGHKHTTSAVLPSVPVPSTSFPYAQKVFPFARTYGVGTAGAGQLNGKSIYFIMRQLEREVLAKPDDERPKSVADLATIVGERARSLLHDEANARGVDPAVIQRNYVQFQVVGYDGEAPKIRQVGVGATITQDEHTDLGSYLIGVGDVAQALWKVRQEPAEYRNFSLQDAVEYAEFLISATASHQRFYGTLPNVGGQIDVALVTPFDGFRWIRQKPLFATIAGEEYVTAQA